MSFSACIPFPPTKRPILPFIQHTRVGAPRRWHVALDDGLGPSAGVDVEDEDGVVILDALATAVDDDMGGR